MRTVRKISAIASLFLLSACSSSIPDSSLGLGFSDEGAGFGETSKVAYASVSDEVRADLMADLESEQQASIAPKLDALAARRLINQYRKKKGLGALLIHPKLTMAAKAHSAELAKMDRISHVGADGANPWQRVERTGFKPKLAAENVGTSQLSLKEVIKGWKASPGHNENLLLPDATHMGIALVHAPDSKLKTFWTLVLGTPL